MTPRGGLRRATVAAGVILAALTACTGSLVSPAGPAATAGVTPMASLSAPVAGTAAALRQHLAGNGGYRLDPLRRSYRPAEPVEFAGTPRAVFQVDVGDPEAGLVMVYEFASTQEATQRGELFADYLGSGFGQTNYPLDAQFALSQVGPTLVFHWWSQDRAEDAARAGGAFDVIARFGLPLDVRK